MVEMKERLDAVYDDNLTSTQAIGSLSVALEEAETLVRPASSTRGSGRADTTSSRISVGP